MLNDLFEQIFHSEATFKERIAQLKQVNTERQARNNYLKDVEQQHMSLSLSCIQGKRTLVAARQQEGWQQNQETILTSQLEMERQTGNQLVSTKKSLEDDIDAMRNQFILEARAFFSAHDLAGKGRTARADQAQRDFVSLSDEMDQLHQEVLILEADRRSADLLESSKEAIERDIRNLLSDREEVVEQLKELQTTVSCHEAECQQLETDAENDPEFQKLLEELESVQKERYEPLCQELKNEVKAVQEQLLRQGTAPGKEATSRKLNTHRKAKEHLGHASFARKPSNESQQGAAVSEGVQSDSAAMPMHLAAEMLALENFWSDDDDDDSLQVVGGGTGDSKLDPQHADTEYHTASSHATKKRSSAMSTLPRKKINSATPLSYSHMQLQHAAKRVKFR